MILFPLAKKIQAAIQAVISMGQSRIIFVTCVVSDKKIPACKILLSNFSLFHSSRIWNQFLQVSRLLNIYHSNQEALSVGKQHYKPLSA